MKRIHYGLPEPERPAPPASCWRGYIGRDAVILPHWTLTGPEWCAVRPTAAPPLPATRHGSSEPNELLISALFVLGCALLVGLLLWAAMGAR